ncbi:MAG TPA: GAF domain-containing protein, partial [Longimicrobium sp.]|nr:GAF domain-containing protein [Longimicrobium sp.]
MLPDAPPSALFQGTDTPEAGFERLAAFAARLLHVPISVISLVDAERPFSAGDASDAWRPRREAPLSRSLCRFAVDGGVPLLLEDAREHPAVRQDPAVWLGEVGYAGIPFRRADGRVAGALCVADGRPRAWTTEEVDVLSMLGR